MSRLADTMTLEDFKELVLPVKNKLFRFALSFLKNEEEAKDVVQEVLIKIWHKGKEISFYNNIEAWCMTMVKNQSLDKLKSKHFNLPGVDDHKEIATYAPDPHHYSELSDTMKLIENTIETLPEKQKYVIRLRDIEGFSYQEISEILELDLNQVKVNLFRARKKIKHELLNAEAYGT
ncbi:sigma-70 family RNA polymerase sigma factor [Fulvivirgaceae bacterium BMA10]|uniref:Sigma-70 family RNA polymerase sigma factor n=1 Tax=Splendidivirga corallicola TaxID=3051826 RepID=A0ABT8KIB1_9BACT|nr:sigma-70 family RNA polymerase sigma factor [Fulvivirgaceae bacterium BMA10]